MLLSSSACFSASLCGERATHSICWRGIRRACSEAGSTTTSSYCRSLATISRVALARWRSSTGSASSSLRLLRENISRACSAEV